VSKSGSSPVPHSRLAQAKTVAKAAATTLDQAREVDRTAEEGAEGLEPPAPPVGVPEVEDLPVVLAVVEGLSVLNARI
jgi:hypothetical protein